MGLNLKYTLFCQVLPMQFIYAYTCIDSPVSLTTFPLGFGYNESVTLTIFPGIITSVNPAFASNL